MIFCGVCCWVLCDLCGVGCVGYAWCYVVCSDGGCVVDGSLGVWLMCMFLVCRFN